MSPASAKSWAKLKRLFSIDVRSLAAFRIGLGVLISLDLVARIPLIEVLYTDHRLVACHASLQAKWPLPESQSARSLSLRRLVRLGSRVHWLNPRVQPAVHNRLSDPLRNRCVVAADVHALWQEPAGHRRWRQHRALLLVLVDVPASRRTCWSVDARRRETRCRRSLVCSAATAALLLQPALLYFVAGIVKDTSPWRDGHAVLVALHGTVWVRPLGVWLSQQGRLVELLTFATRVVEIGAPLLLFLPVFTLRARAVAIASLMALQVGLATSLRLNFFPFYSSVAWLAFVPSAWWDRFSGGRAPVSDLSLPSVPARPWKRYLLRARDAIVLGALGLGTVVGLARSADPGLVSRAAMALGFAQRWYMYRYIEDDYVRIHSVATLANGASIDLRTADQGHLLDSPLGEDWARSYRADIILEAMAGGDRALSQAFARFVCRRWNADPGFAARESGSRL